MLRLQGTMNFGVRLSPTGGRASGPSTEPHGIRLGAFTYHHASHARKRTETVSFRGGDVASLLPRLHGLQSGCRPTSRASRHTPVRFHFPADTGRVRAADLNRLHNLSHRACPDSRARDHTNTQTAFGSQSPKAFTSWCLSMKRLSVSPWCDRISRNPRNLEQAHALSRLPFEQLRLQGHKLRKTPETPP